MGNTSTLALLVGSCLLTACATDGADGIRTVDEPLPARQPEEPDAWVLVVADEFDGPALDRTLWSARTGDLVHPNTLNSGSPEMVSVDGGSLVVGAVPTPEDERFPYTAGYVETRGLFAQTYGKVEFSVRCQFAPGLWYAVWGRPWQNAVPEVDVEFLAENVTQVWFVNHWALPPLKPDERRDFVALGGLDITRFHTYAIVWKPDLVEWQVDGKPYKRTTGKGVPHEPMYWIANAWVGGWGGPVSPSTRFPARFEVDWFRIYRLKDWAAPPSVRVASTKWRYTDADTIDVEIADLERSAHVDVYEGGVLVERLARPPFKLAASKLRSGVHQLRIVATDGTRTADIDATVNVK